MLNKYFSTNEKKEIRYTAQINSRKKEFIIKKESSYFINVDLARFGKKGKREVHVFTPIKISTLSFLKYFSNRKIPNITNLINLTPKDIIPKLIEMKWKIEEIEDYIREHRELGLVEKYLEEAENKNSLKTD